VGPARLGVRSQKAEQRVMDFYLNQSISHL
jgi:hypothetical protein